MISRALASGSRIGVDDLAKLTGVAPVTIRRDLIELEALGAVRRVHGGAVRTAKRGEPMPFAARFAEDQAQKLRLAAVAAAQVSDYESVIIDNGTTCFAVATELVGRPLTVLALSLHAASVLAGTTGPQVIVPGGPVESDSLACLSSTAVDAVREFRADVALLGACSAAAGTGLTSTSYHDAATKKAIIAASSRRILVSASDKLTRTSSFRFGTPEQLTTLITDSGAPQEVLELFRVHGVDVHIA